MSTPTYTDILTTDTPNTGRLNLNAGIDAIIANGVWLNSGGTQSGSIAISGSVTAGSGIFSGTVSMGALTATTGSFTGNVTIVGTLYVNPASVPAVETTNQGLIVYSYGSTPTYLFRKALGTFGTPTYPGFPDFLGSVIGQGWDVNAAAWQTRSRLNFKTAEAWTATAQGTMVELTLTYATTLTSGVAFTVTPTASAMDMVHPNGGVQARDNFIAGDLTVGSDPLGATCANNLTLIPVTAGAQTGITLIGKNKTSGGSLGQLNFGHYSSGSWYRTALIGAQMDAFADAGRIVIYTQPTGGSLTIRMIINRDGAVTVGSTDGTGSGPFYASSGVFSGALTAQSTLSVTGLATINNQLVINTTTPDIIAQIAGIQKWQTVMDATSWRVYNAGLAANAFALDFGTSDATFAGNIFTATTKGVASSTYSSGWAGSGYSLSWTNGASSYLELDRLTVRGTMNVYELLIQQIRATNGAIVVTASAKVDSIPVANDIIFTDPSGNSVQPFAAGDLIRAQRWDATKSQLRLVEASVTAVSVGGDGKRITVSYHTSTAQAGDEFVRIGSTVTGRKGLIYITADDANAPYMDVIDGVGAWADWGTLAVTKARIGLLSGITDADFGGTLSGYGLYSQNVYIKGTLKTSGGSKRMEIRASDNEMDFYDSGNQIVRIGSSVSNQYSTSGIAVSGGSVTMTGATGVFSNEIVPTSTGFSQNACFASYLKFNVAGTFGTTMRGYFDAPQFVSGSTVTEYRAFDAIQTGAGAATTYTAFYATIGLGATVYGLQVIASPSTGGTAYGAYLNVTSGTGTAWSVYAVAGKAYFAVAVLIGTTSLAGSELLRVAGQVNANSWATNGTAGLLVNSISGSASVSLFVAATSGGSPTTQLHKRTITLSDGTTYDVLVQ